uniref:Alpha N-terminal protein methyltransferase 1 n=1 Tax=Chlamydomonas leiostraca TaxID=1034604 RepID=A0A7S0X200_9CHLO
MISALAAAVVIIAIITTRLLQPSAGGSGTVETKEDKAWQPLPPKDAPKKGTRLNPEEAGYSTDGQVYKSLYTLWQAEQHSMEEWYDRSVAWWDKQDPTNDGVMLGSGHLHDADIRESRALLEKTYSWWEAGKLAEHGHTWAALDAGAGIGRVTKALLLHLFGRVDLVEPSAAMMAQAQADLGSSAHWPGTPEGHKVEELMQMGLQEALFQPFRYHVVWVQECLMYLSDEDVVKFFVKARMGLEHNGVFFVKERVAARGFQVDRGQARVTRSRHLLERLFGTAELMVLDHAAAAAVPRGAHGVHMWTLTRAPPKSNPRQQEFDAAYAAGRVRKPEPSEQDLGWLPE